MCHPSWARALTEAQRQRDLAQLRPVRDRTDRDYAQPLDVEALAHGTHMPAGHLSRQFLLAYGESPHFLPDDTAERPGESHRCAAATSPSPAGQHEQGRQGHVKP